MSRRRITLCSSIPIALLTTAMELPARFALLLAMVSVVSLPPPFRTACRTAVALATVATNTNCQHGLASQQQE